MKGNKMKNIKRASFRFNEEIFHDFKELCKKEGFSQVKLLEKLMLEEIKKNKKGNKGNKGNEK